MEYKNPIDLPAWSRLEELAKSETLNMKEEFSRDKERVKKYSLDVKLSEEHGLHVDYSKNLINDTIWRTLQQLVLESDLEGHRKAMFDGAHINDTEDRAVLHTALRASPMGVSTLPRTVREPVAVELQKMREFCEALHSGTWTGWTGKRISDVVNIGIGGSDLGPRMAVEALQGYVQSESPRVHFVSNVDALDLAAVLQQCPPDSTLFIIVSKTFTTLETMTNATAAKAWFLRHSEQKGDLGKHFVAVSTNAAAVRAFGIPDDGRHMFSFWDFVGGRYSLWSSVGLAIATRIGMDGFMQLLGGAEAMDAHFMGAPFGQNVPVILALLGIWSNNFLGAQTHAVLPYEQALALLPRYLQQLDMESNGKGVTRANEPILGRWQTGPILWGEPGTNGQHAFFQLLHQGSKLVSIDFLAGFQPSFTSDPRVLDSASWDSQHRLLLANMLAQAEALMSGTAGQAEEQGLPLYRHFSGNKPSTVLLYWPKLSPFILGALLAMYEHKVFVQGHIWNINSFDQWGVELGKKMANAILHECSSPSVSVSHDPSTASLLKKVFP